MVLLSLGNEVGNKNKYCILKNWKSNIILDIKEFFWEMGDLGTLV